MNIAFLWNFRQAKEIYPNWRDGLRSALDIIGEKHRVDWFLGEDCQNVKDKYDFLLFWSDSNDELIKKYITYKGRKGLCLTTDPHNIENLRNYDVIFCESDPILEQIRRNGLRGIKAFGVDTDLFKPYPRGRKKDIEYFYPATFSPWKRQSEIAHLGNKLWCIGTLQPDGEMELKTCIDNKVHIMFGYYPVERIRSYYRRSKNVIIPAIHGSERTVLEAMACGIRPIVTHKENVRTSSYIKELDKSTLTPRSFVINNYSHFIYAQNLLRGIEY